MENEKNEEKINIDLGVLWRNFVPYLRRLWLLVLILAVLAGVRSYIRVTRSYRPMYKAETIFSVSTGSTSDESDIFTYSYYYNNTAAKQAVNTFPYLLNSDVMRELLCLELGTSSINGSISASLVNGTNFFVLSVTSADPQAAYDIIQAVMKVYPQIGQKVIGDIQLVVTKEPMVPTTPYNSAASWHRSVVMSAAKVCALGLVLIFLLSLTRRTILSAQDVKKMVSLSCLAHIPSVSVKQRKRSKAAGLLITRLESDSGFCEAFRLLRLKLTRTMGEGDKVIMFTSSIPSEGKSSIAANTALSLAKEGKQVLLIDGDLRSPSIKELLGLSSPSQGLGEYLADKSDNGIDCLRYADTKLVVLAGNKAINNPASLLRSKKLASTLDRARGIFDYIIIDTPPCVMADASVFAKYADKVVYVIREDFAKSSQVYDCLQSLIDGGAKVCGFVLNCSTHQGSGSGYGSGYGYGYGYSYGKKYGSKYGYGKEKTKDTGTAKA